MEMASLYCPVSREMPALAMSRAIMGSLSFSRNFCHSGSSSSSGSSLGPKVIAREDATAVLRPSSPLDRRNSSSSVVITHAW